MLRGAEPQLDLFSGNASLVPALDYGTLLIALLALAEVAGGP
jgi:hypothetical protein